MSIQWTDATWNVADHSVIEWTDATWNVVTGCAKISPGCAHCYAEAVAMRFWATQYPPVVINGGVTSAFRDSVPSTRPRAFTDVHCHEDRLEQPLRWKKPRRVFVNSMSDLFHEHVPFPFIAAVFGVMAYAKRHTFQVLTKRAAQMHKFFDWVNHADGALAVGTGPDGHGPVKLLRRMLRVDEDVANWFYGRTTEGVDLAACLHNSDVWPLQNVWLGVSVENQRFADERIPLLLQTPAVVRFISAEPLLEAIDLRAFLSYSPHHEYDSERSTESRGETYDSTSNRYQTAASSWGKIAGFSGGVRGGFSDHLSCRSWRSESLWVIVGGESGPQARPMDLAWPRALVQQCQAANVPVFYKQGGTSNRCVHDSKGGCLSCIPIDLHVREFPNGTRS